MSAKPAKPDPQTVDSYIAAQPAGVQPILNRVRAAIRKGVPKAEESISYMMPTYKWNGAKLICFAVWKQQYSLYAATAAVVAAFGDELAPYKLDKGTIRFPLAEPVPAKLIERITKFRLQEAVDRA